ncbi:MAG: transposase, partial [Lachnospiraceae bacterium]|nr:transposase [Lachnospiraceae bacterium]
MGAQDTVTRDYVNEADIFADAFNYLIFNGEQVVDAKTLQSLDTSLLLNIFGGWENDISEKENDELEVAAPKKQRKKKKKSNEAVQRYRDAIKTASLKRDDHFAYMIFGIEAQTHIHYAMPVRNLVYDGLQYAAQVEQFRIRHDLSGNEGVTDEFLSGLYRGDRLLPVITLVIYFGSKPWDGVLNLRDLLDVPDNRVLPFIQDYKVFLIEPAKMTDDDFDKFSTNLGKVLKFLQRSADKKKMDALLAEDDAFKSLDRKAAMVIKNCANIDVDLEECEVTNMCKA